MKKTSRKLKLNMQSVRLLTPRDLEQARGGNEQEPTIVENGCTVRKTTIPPTSLELCEV